MTGRFARQSRAFRALALSLSGAFAVFACGRTAPDLELSSAGSEPALNPADSPPISSAGGAVALGGATTGGKPISVPHAGASTTTPDGPEVAEAGRANGGTAGVSSGGLGGLGETASTGAGGDGAGGDGTGGGGASGSGGDGEAAGGDTGRPLSNCCAAKATPSCDTPQVATCVCEGQGQFGGDPFCCSSSWDQQCAEEVQKFACGVCQAVP